MEKEGMKKVNIGLDLGITSVGWAITDENLTLIERGVRLFEPLDNEKGELYNAIRRRKRSMRRQTSRRKNLKKDFVKLLYKYNLVSDIIWVPNKNQEAKVKRQISLQAFTHEYIIGDKNLIYERQKGLVEKLDFKTLISILYWYLDNRGFNYEVVESEKTERPRKEYDVFYKSDREYIVERQIDFFEAKGFFRSDFNREFSTNDYLKEISKILETNFVSDDFNKFYVSLFKRRRNFEQGPGPQTIEQAQKILNAGGSLSPFGRFVIEDGKLKEYKTVWEKTVGKCIVYPNEDRAPKGSFSAELFNLLEDLNRISIGEEKQKLTVEQKIKIINICLKKKAKYEDIESFLNEKFENETFSGFRENPKGKDGVRKRIITELSVYHQIKSIFKKEKIANIDINFDGNFEDFFFLDDIIVPCYLHKEVEKRVEVFSKLKVFKDVGDEKLKIIANQIKVMPSTHSLSFKALRQYSLELLQLNELFAVIHLKQIVEASKKEKGQLGKYIKTEWIDNLVASPTVKKGVREAIKILNAIIKKRKNYQVQNIVIEMARESNRKEEKENIEAMQAARASVNAKIAEYLKNHKSKTGFDSSKRVSTKLWLYIQQNGLDPYDGHKLPSPDDIIEHPSLVDIDHIIPYSQIFENGRKNLVLTKSGINSKKGNRSSYQYITETYGKDAFEERQKQWTHMFLYNPNGEVFNSVEKFNLLRDQTDYSIPSNALGFINRNLNDTRFITVEVLSKISSFTKNVSHDHPWYDAKIKTVNGKLTSFVGRLADSGDVGLIRPEGFDKERRIDPNDSKKARQWNGHHSEDAFLIMRAVLRNPELGKWMERSLPWVSFKSNEQKAENIGFLKSLGLDEIRDQLNRSVNEVKFSFAQVSRRNIEFANETLYGGKIDESGKLHKIVKYDLADSTKAQLEKLFRDDYPYVIPMKEFDKKTFDAIKSKFHENEDLPKPFAKLCADNGGRLKLNIGKNNTTRNIAYIKTIQNEKNEMEVIKSPNNANSFYDTLGWIELQLFKDTKDVNRVVPVNAVNHFITKSGVFPRKDIWAKFLESKGIDKNAKPWGILKFGTQICDLENNLWKVVGHRHPLNFIEIERIDGFMEKERARPSVNQPLRGWHICEVDELGRIKKVSTF